MRKTTLLMGVVAGLAVGVLAVRGGGGGTALADNGPHVVESGATPDKCAGCHRIHTGQNDFLLKEAGTGEEFWFTWHGARGAGRAPRAPPRRRRRRWRSALAPAARRGFRPRPPAPTRTGPSGPIRPTPSG